MLFYLFKKLLATTTLVHYFYPSFSLKNLDHTFAHFQNELQGLNYKKKNKKKNKKGIRASATVVLKKHIGIFSTLNTKNHSATMKL